AWEPHPVGSHPRGASAFGVQDLVGNGWEWTRSEFFPLPGFRAFSFYPGYSRDFFDGQHFVLKGGGPRTAARLLRRSFRTWLQPHPPPPPAPRRRGGRGPAPPPPHAPASCARATSSSRSTCATASAAKARRCPRAGSTTSWAPRSSKRSACCPSTASRA